jgi:hypothetical protein
VTDGFENPWWPIVEQMAKEVGYGEVVDATTIPQLVRSGSRKRAAAPSSVRAGGKRELVILPQRQFLLPLHDLHSSDGQDCTHFCSSPDLFLPAWRSLRIAMDDYFL